MSKNTKNSFLGKRRSFNCEEKKTLLDAYQKLPKMPKTEAAKRLNIPRTTLNDILKNPSELGQMNQFDHLKKQRMGKDATVESALYDWLLMARDKNAMLSGPLCRTKAEELAKKMGKNDFVATDGWFQRWKKRYGLMHKKLHGEGEAADFPAQAEWMEKVWPSLRKCYKDEEIWNADETGLFYRAIPDHTLTLKTDKRRGGKVSKERITVLFCASMTGEKKRLFLIGKSKSPRCFKGVQKLPVDYEANSNAWMTGQLFNIWLDKWNRELKRQGKKILLLLDNFSGHKVTQELSQIKVVFFPPNTTSSLQPCDQGIIRTTKHFYRTALCKFILQKLEDSNVFSASDVTKTVTLLDAIQFLNESWSKLSSASITNCWNHAGLNPLVLEEVLNEDEEEPLERKMADIHCWGDKLDEEIQCHELLTEDQIIKNALEREREKEKPEVEEDEGEEDQFPIPSLSEVNSALNVLHHALKVKDFDFTEFLSFRKKVEKCLNMSLKQSTIDKFFAKV